MKVCSKCGIEKEETDFHKNSRSKDGFSAMCKECKNENAREYYYRKKARELKEKDSASKEFEKEFGKVYNNSDSCTNIVNDNDYTETDCNYSKYKSKLERAYAYVYGKIAKLWNKVKYILFTY